MSILGPSLLRRLSRLRLAARQVGASTPHGGRTSGHVGSGVEFAEYRTYQPGDDARRVDPGVLARLGQRVVRQQHADRGLDVTVVVDMTASMGVGSKARHAASIAAGLMWIALQQGDRVRVAAFDGDGVQWAPVASDRRRSAAAIEWLAARRAHGRSALGPVVRSLGPRLVRHSLLILVSDAWHDDLLEAVRALAGYGQEIVVVVVLDPSEIEPERLGLGSLELQDAETGAITTIDVSPEQLRRRRRFVAAWHDRLKRELATSGGRVAVVPTHHDVELVLSRDLVRAGIVT